MLPAFGAFTDTSLSPGEELKSMLWKRSHGTDAIRAPSKRQSSRSKMNSPLAFTVNPFRQGRQFTEFEHVVRLGDVDINHRPFHGQSALDAGASSWMVNVASPDSKVNSSSPSNARTRSKTMSLQEFQLRFGFAFASQQ